MDTVQEKVRHSPNFAKQEHEGIAHWLI